MKKLLTVVALTAALFLTAGPVAGAQPVAASTNFASPVVGFFYNGLGWVGSQTPFVNSRLVAQTNDGRPAETKFTYGGTHCGCTITWRNVDTGATGSWTMSPVQSIDGWWVQTGSGRIEATARIDGRFSFTVIAGRGSWTVP